MGGSSARSSGKIPLREIPVVVLSAHADAASYAAQMDAEGYLRKPIDLRALLETVERFCARDG